MVDENGECDFYAKQSFLLEHRNRQKVSRLNNLLLGKSRRLIYHARSHQPDQNVDHNIRMYPMA